MKLAIILCTRPEIIKVGYTTIWWKISILIQNLFDYLKGME
jgi:hypothetical protein